jgi:multiple sugar transport system substrate-binding protein
MSSIGRRRLLQLGGLAALAPALGSCGDPAADPDRALAFQGWDFEPQAVQDNLSRFTGQSGVKVDFTSITGSQYVQKSIAEFTAGSQADALYVYDDSMAGWVDAGYLQPIDGLPGVDKVYDAIFPGNAEAMTHNGKRYCLPYYSDCAALLYNAELLKKGGFDAPPKTLEELTHQAVQLRERGVLKYSLGFSAQLSDSFWGWIWSLLYASGGKMFDDDLQPVMATTDPVPRELFTWLDHAVRVAKIIDPASLQMGPVPVDEALSAGQYAYTFAARYGARAYNEPGKSKIAGKMKMAVVPGVSGPGQGLVLTTRMYGISAGTKRRDDAIKLLTYLGGFDESGTPYTAKFWFLKYGLGFAFKDLGKDPEVVAEIKRWGDPGVYRELSETAKARNVVAKVWYSEFETELQKAVQRILAGQGDPDGAVKALDAKARELMTKYG